jgi:dihydroflavonol-4-reductase
VSDDASYLGPRFQHVLVTGGCGFLGRRLVAALAERVHTLRVLDTAPPIGLPRGTEYICGSVLDRSAVSRALDGVTCVYHLAGLANFWTADRADFDRVNRVGTECMLAGARDQAVTRFVHCSTEVVLLPAQRRDEPIDEYVMPALSDMAGPYSRSKYLAERAAMRAAARGQHVVIVNPTVPIGPGDHHFTPPTAMLARYLSGARLFLDCTLNLVDTRDLAHGMILAAERGRSGERYVLGGENVTLDELLHRIDRLEHRQLRRLRVPRWLALATGATSEWLASAITRRTPIATTESVRVALRSAALGSGKAMRDLGYRPRAVEDALKATVQWLSADAVG